MVCSNRSSNTKNHVWRRMATPASRTSAARIIITMVVMIGASATTTGATSSLSNVLPSWKPVDFHKNDNDASTTATSSSSSSSSSYQQQQQKQQRRLYNDNDNDNYEVDISNFSIRFGKCQHVKMFSDELAEENNNDNDNNNNNKYGRQDSILATKHFVIYRLCPSDECDTCDDVYGEYVTTVEDYLQATAEYQRKRFENMCENNDNNNNNNNGCNEQCNDDGTGCDEDGCGYECYKYANMENAGYVDASEYIECKKLDVDFNDGNDDDDDDDEEFQLYIGPRCSADGTRIYIDLFSDEECWEPHTNHTVEEVLGMELSYHLLKNTYSSDGADCLSCMEDDNDQNENDRQDEDMVNEMCEEVYSSSAKCESIHGIPNGFINMNREEKDYENQVANEYAVCTFIDSLIFDSYTETGEINIFEEQDVIIRKATTLQIVVLSVLSATLVGLAMYASYMHRFIELTFPNIDFTNMCQGGTMA